MRIFTAINFDDEIKKKLYNYISIFKNEGINANYSFIENLHLTLKFFGEIDDFKIEKLKKVLDSISENTKPFEITFNKLGYFNKRDSIILWIGIEHSHSLINLYKTFITSSKLNGLEVEEEFYSPHITIARNVKIKTKSLEDFISKINFNKFSYNVSSLDIMESTRINDKLTYISKYKIKF